ncbi:hypothetical protein [Amycolatopsis taiwanensis]|uniref:hypothetical protein n=1 Tax=Amycolatopsis taiwanensis TaxID=342230 RepID=UPI000489EF43|nr:hypothetical protein [Amycolatopsis taiwanensis]
MAARIMTPPPTGKHARLGVLDHLRAALLRLLSAAPRAFAALLVVALCVGVGLGVVVAGVLW